MPDRVIERFLPFLSLDCQAQRAVRTVKRILDRRRGPWKRIRARPEDRKPFESFRVATMLRRSRDRVWIAFFKLR